MSLPLLLSRVQYITDFQFFSCPPGWKPKILKNCNPAILAIATHVGRQVWNWPIADWQVSARIVAKLSDNAAGKDRRGQRLRSEVAFYRGACRADGAEASVRKGGP